jgi:cell division protein FtsQ
MKRKRNRYRPDRTRQKAAIVRWCKRIVWLNLMGAGVLLVSSALAHSYHALLDMPWLNVEDVEIKGLQRLDRQEVLDTLALPQPSSVLKIRTVMLARRLENHPWVEAAIVRTEPPRRVVIEVVERQPLALVYCKGFFLMDYQGKLFMEAKPENHPNLPMLTGLAGSDLKLGDTLPADAFQSLGNLLGVLERMKSWLPLQNLSELKWQDGDGFTLFTTRGSIPIHLGGEPFDEKLRRLQSVLKIVTERQWWDTVQAIDLDYPRQAFIKGVMINPKGI